MLGHYIGLTICAMLGVVLAVVMISSCVFFGLARLCGGCGAGIKKNQEQPRDKTKRIVLAVVVLVLVGLIM